MSEQSKLQHDPYYRVDPYEKGAKIEWCETYDMLRGPNGFECLLTEPEDRTWWRDGSAVVEELNRQHALIERLQNNVEFLQTSIDVLLKEKRELLTKWL